MIATQTHPAISTTRASEQGRRTSAPAATYDRNDSQGAGYDLFRRAILLRDGDAWIEIGTRYRAMLISWAAQSSSAAASCERCEDIADRALARAWAALTPERFVQFPSLAALLAYLRSCVGATAIDMARAQSARDRAHQKLEADAVATPEQVVLDEIERTDLWRAALDAAEGERERVLLVESFQYDLPPRAILARHPELFGDIREVYLTKRHLLARLQRSPEVRRFLG